MMLKRQPDFHTIWNYRREILNTLLKDANKEKRKAYLKDEFEIVSYGLRNKNPKSYSLWHHRRWIVSKYTSEESNEGHEILKQELKLCTTFLKHDERNFHCWNYRGFLVSSLGMSDEDNLKFTKEKVLENFSNYSALHRRMRLFSKRSEETKDDEEKLREFLSSEIEMIKHSIFTEPDDQSPWLYLRWMMELARKRLKPEAVDKEIRSIVECCRAICEEEKTEMKWPLLTELHLRRMLSDIDDDDSSRTREILKVLCEIDGDHRVYYEELIVGG